jgi:hypothetical protein
MHFFVRVAIQCNGRDLGKGDDFMSPFEIVMLVIQMIRLVLDYCIHLGKERKVHKAQRLAQGRTILFAIRVKTTLPAGKAARAGAGEQAAAAEHIMEINDQKEPAPVKKAS